MNFEKEIELLKERNKKVEVEKAWEISLTRKISILCITYIFVVLLMITINVPSPHLNALVPTLGFLLSTLSITCLKKIWINKIFQKTFETSMLRVNKKD